MTLHVFLVEDDPLIRVQLIEVMVSMLDVQFIGVESSEPAAIEWLAHPPRHWDLVVMDLLIEQGTGFAVMTTMGLVDANQRVVALTNSATPENRARALRCGAHAVFDKTAELTEFLDYCKQL